MMKRPRVQIGIDVDAPSPFTNIGMEDHGDAMRVRSPDLTGMGYRISIAQNFHTKSVVIGTPDGDDANG